MKYLVVLALVAAVSADVSHVVQNADYSAPVVRSSYDISPEGAFEYAYETGNGIVAQAEGVVKNTNAENPTLEVKGSYSYKAADGTPVELVYVANENGFQPQGSHLPVPPPVPELILRGLNYIEAHPPKTEVKPLAG